MEAEMILPDISCIKCGRGYPQDGVPYRCPTCGGLFDQRDGLRFDPARVDLSQPGIWRYRHTFGLDGNIEPISLGEGNTPLVWVEWLGRRVALKCEYLNPSGSFKDRGSAVIAAWMRSRGAAETVEDSSGNAGASFAAYAARAGIKAHIYVPESASGPKRKQIETYGADLVPIPGSRSDVAEAVRKAAEQGSAYASHANIPFNLPGYATAAYEIFEQIGQMAGAIVVPAGQGGLLLGLARGFDTLGKAHSLVTVPRMIGVQASACAPLWAQFNSNGKQIKPIEEKPTLAEGVRVPNPLRQEAVRAAIAAGRGSIFAVDEDEILPARDTLARLGFYVEPTSAIVWPVLTRILANLPDPVVVVLTGSGLKYG
jgi:threonine synthase